MLGSELVTNGDFSAWTGDNPDWWTLNSAEDANNYVTEDTGKARIVSNNTLAIGLNHSGTVIGKSYLYNLDVASLTGTLSLAGVSKTITGVTGNISQIGISISPVILVLRGGVMDATIDNVSVKEVIWSTFLSNVTDYKFKTEVVYSIDPTIADGDIAGIAFKVGDLTAGSEDFCRVELNKGTGKVELKKVVAGTETTPLSAAVTYSAGATLLVMSADGIKWIVVYNGSQVGTEQTINEASLDSSVAGFMATSASTTFDNWKAGKNI